MKNFDDIEELVDYMFENTVEEDGSISVVANKDLAVEILKEFMNYKGTTINVCTIDSDADYDKEYVVSLSYDGYNDKWYVGIDRAYISEKHRYISTGGYVLFHEDVNSKAMIDMQNNEFMPITGHDWFTIGEEDIEEDDPEQPDEDNEVTNDSDSDENEETEDSGYSVTVKVDLDTDEAEEIIRDMRKNFQREFSDMFDWLYRPYPYFFEYHPWIYG